MRTLFWPLAAAGALAAGSAAAETIRFATFNASLNRGSEGALAADLAAGDDAQIRRVAEVIQRVRPDVLLVNELDYAPDNPRLFVENYLNVPQNASGLGPTEPIDYPHVFVAPSNTGVQSGFDLDNDGTVGGPGDAFGFGFFPGQFGMAVLSREPIDRSQVRTFREFLWKDLPGARLPTEPDGEPYYSEAELEALRLSSKSHWDVPVEIDGETVHFLVSHPTPPVFDGPEDRNGLRNFDEIRFWAEYVEGEDALYDDSGERGGLDPRARFVIAGDLNADPFDGDSVPGAVGQVLDNPLIQGSATDATITPAGEGGVDAAASQGGANVGQRGDPAFDTSDFGFNPDNPAEDLSPGNLRVDYVLPSEFGLRLVDQGVFWPAFDDPLSDLAAFPTSDHRLVWIDVELTRPAPIPLPASAWLLGGALAALALARPRLLRRGS